MDGLIVIVVMWVVGALILYCLAPYFYLEHGFNRVVRAPPSEPVVPCEESAAEMLQAPSEPLVPREDTAVEMLQAPSEPVLPREDTAVEMLQAPEAGSDDTPRLAHTASGRRVAAELARWRALVRGRWPRWADTLALSRHLRPQAPQPPVMSGSPRPAEDTPDLSALAACTDDPPRSAPAAEDSQRPRRPRWPRWTGSLCLSRPSRRHTTLPTSLLPPSCPLAEPESPFFYIAPPPSYLEALRLLQVSDRDPLSRPPPFNPHYVTVTPV